MLFNLQAYPSRRQIAALDALISAVSCSVDHVETHAETHTKTHAKTGFAVAVIYHSGLVVRCALSEIGDSLRNVLQLIMAPSPNDFGLLLEGTLLLFGKLDRILSAQIPLNALHNLFKCCEKASYDGALELYTIRWEKIVKSYTVVPSTPSPFTRSSWSDESPLFALQLAHAQISCPHPSWLVSSPLSPVSLLSSTLLKRYPCHSLPRSFPSSRAKKEGKVGISDNSRQP